MTDQEIRAKALECALLSLQVDPSRIRTYSDFARTSDVGEIAILEAARFIPYITTGSTAVAETKVDRLLNEAASL